jgi:hypothetical protein
MITIFCNFANFRQKNGVFSDVKVKFSQKVAMNYFVANFFLAKNF